MPEEHPQASDDALHAQARAAILAEQNPSVAFLQRKFRLGYQQALALMQRLENDVVTAPGPDGWRRMLDSGRPSPDARVTSSPTSPARPSASRKPWTA